MIRPRKGKAVALHLKTIFEVPTANITQNMQVGRFTRLTEAVSAIQKTGGLSAFYVGYGTMVMREIPFSFIQFPLYERPMAILRSERFRAGSRRSWPNSRAATQRRCKAEMGCNSTNKASLIQI